VMRGAASPHRLLHVERERAAAGSSATAASPSSPLARRRAPRRLPTSAERVLDAPDLVDDYYLVLPSLPPHLLFFPLCVVNTSLSLPLRAPIPTAFARS
jgi:hypothetical protein